jgi:hypothetical protein
MQSLDAHADDRLPRDPLGRVEGGVCADDAEHQVDATDGFQSVVLEVEAAADRGGWVTVMSGHGHDEAGGPAHTAEVADGVFAYIQPDGSWWLNNTGFVRGDGDVVAIDATSTERRTRALLSAIQQHVAGPVRTLVNTHHHGDHTNGNCLFADASIVGHRNCRAGVRAQVIGGLEPVFGPVDWGDLEIRPPTVVFDDRLDVYAGDRVVELHYIGTPAHHRRRSGLATRRSGAVRG